jgi:hypothetical protein
LTHPSQTVHTKKFKGQGVYGAVKIKNYVANAKEKKNEKGKKRKKRKKKKKANHLKKS